MVKKIFTFLMVPAMLIPFIINAQSVDYKNIKGFYEMACNHFPDTVLEKSQKEFQQRKYQKLIEMIMPYASFSDSFPDSPSEAEACHMLTTALLTTQNPQGYTYLEKLITYSQQNDPAHKTAEYYIHYSDVLTFFKTLFSYELVEQAKIMLKQDTMQSPQLMRKAWQVSGKNLLSQGKPKPAVDDFKAAMVLFENNTKNVFEQQKLYSNLSIAYNMTGQADSALKYSRKALKILEMMPSAPQMSLSNVYGNLSRALMLNNQLDSAIHYRKKALTINKKLTGIKSRQTGGSYYHLADTYLYKEDYDSALYNIQKSILTNYPGTPNTLTYSKLPSQLESNSNVNAVLQGLMEKILIMESLYEATSDKKWIKFITEHYTAIDTLVNQLQRSVNLQSLPRVIELNRQGYEQGLISFEEYQNVFPDKDVYHKIYHFATATKTKTLLAQMYNMRGSGETDDNDALKRKRRQLENKLNNLLVAKQDKTTPGSSDSLNQEIILTKIAISGLIDHSGKQPSKKDSEKITKPVTPEKIKLELKTDEAFMEYFMTENHIYAFIITTENKWMHKIPRDEVFERAYREFLRNIKTGRKWAKPDLTEILLKPFYEQIQNKDHLIIIPDNELHNVPFEALHVPWESRPLIEQHTISYHYSARLWLQSKKASESFHLKEPQYNIISFAPGFTNENHAATAENLNFRNINMEDYRDIFKGDNRNYLAPLPFSLQEVEFINTLFTQNEYNSRMYKETEATETNFRGLPSTEILHIATHGFSSNNSPELSGLFFSTPPNLKTQAEENGILYINELFNLNLDANLAVLSACKSGTGKILKGEGIYALPRGFIFAGVPNMIASMWKIHDEKTMEMISMFYEAVAEGQSYRKALQTAKVNMIENGELPVDWSGLIFIGY